LQVIRNNYLVNQEIIMLSRAIQRIPFYETGFTRGESRLLANHVRQYFRQAGWSPDSQPAVFVEEIEGDFHQEGYRVVVPVDVASSFDLPTESLATAGEAQDDLRQEGYPVSVVLSPRLR